MGKHFDKYARLPSSFDGDLGDFLREVALTLDELTGDAMFRLRRDVPPGTAYIMPDPGPEHDSELVDVVANLLVELGRHDDGLTDAYVLLDTLSDEGYVVVTADEARRIRDIDKMTNDLIAMGPSAPSSCRVNRSPKRPASPNSKPTTSACGNGKSRP